jgi:hypothetical protein
MRNGPKVDDPTVPPNLGAVQFSETSMTPSPRPWERPLLTAFGDLRELTMGTSPATGESGQPLVFRT